MDNNPYTFSNDPDNMIDHNKKIKEDIDTLTQQLETLKNVAGCEDLMDFDDAAESVVNEEDYIDILSAIEAKMDSD